jgi:hypothetical protein
MEFGNCKDLPVWAQILLQPERPAEGERANDSSGEIATPLETAAA